MKRAPWWLTTHGDMLPGLIPDDVVDGRSTNTESPGERWSVGCPAGMCESDLPHLLIGEPGPRDVFSPRKRLGPRAGAIAIANRTPSLGCHVAHVVCGGSREEVLNVHARRVVAVVADNETIGNASVLELPGHNVSTRGSAPVPHVPIGAIFRVPSAVATARPGPQPTRRSEHRMDWTVLVDLRPKAFLEGRLSEQRKTVPVSGVAAIAQSASMGGLSTIWGRTDLPHGASRGTPRGELRAEASWVDGFGFEALSARGEGHTIPAAGDIS